MLDPVSIRYLRDYFHAMVVRNYNLVKLDAMKDILFESLYNIVPVFTHFS
jgi:hypothetical protein